MGQQPPGYPQAPWLQGGPPQKGNNLKWLLVAIAVLLVIGVTIGATLLFSRGNGDAPTTPSASAAPGDIASAGDTAPVSIITDEPTCKAYTPINDGLAVVEANGWSMQRSTLGAVSEWTPDQRTQIEAVAVAMRNAADQTIALVKQTPNRVVRELYQQFIAYGRAYADSVSSYTPKDNFLADANVNFGNALLGICNAITFKSVSRSIAVAPAAAPTDVAKPANVTDPQVFISAQNPSCTAWVDQERQFISATSDWSRLDTNVAAADWTPAQRTVQLDVLPVLSEMANNMEETGRRSGDPAFEDFSVLAAQYFRGYVSAGDEYSAADSWLSYIGLRINNAISGACQAEAI
jgi:hypothetical protein